MNEHGLSAISLIFLYEITLAKMVHEAIFFCVYIKQ
jgi:hypothetical protein